MSFLSLLVFVCGMTRACSCHVARLLVLFRVNLPDARTYLKVTDDAKRILQRRYWALVIGSPRQRKGLISAPLVKVRIFLNALILTPHPCAPSAITLYKIIKFSYNLVTNLILMWLSGSWLQ